MPADFERLVDELEERLARSTWSLSRGPNSVMLSSGWGGGAAGSKAWSSTTLTVSYERASDHWVVTETLHQGTTETGDDGGERVVGRFPSAAAAIQLLADRAGS
jgi:hypothetical protein